MNFKKWRENEWNEIKSILGLFKIKRFWLLIISIISFFIITAILPKQISDKLFIWSLIFLLITYGIYFFTYSLKQKRKIIPNWQHWMFLLLLTISVLVYFFVLTKRYELAVPLIISLVLLIFVTLGVRTFGYLWSSKNIVQVGITYFVFVFILISIFGYVFGMCNAYDSNSVVYPNGTALTLSAWDSVYFSSAVFYNTYNPFVVGSLCSRVASQLEIASAFFFHTVILALIIDEILHIRRENMKNRKSD